MVQAITGLALGLPVATFCVRYVRSQLYDVTGADSWVLAGAILVLIGAASLAGWIPARRAASIDPVQALRVE
jgi:ABC-type antimicrobial peptide transport system permease subunit